MTTDQDKLQKLFQAALNDASAEKATLARAFPKSTPVTPQMPPQVTAMPAPQAFQIPAEPVAPAAPAAAEDCVQPMANAGLDEAAAEELRILLDEQHLRLKRKRRRETVCALAVFFAITGGGFGWFVHSPDRVQAFKDAIRDIRSAGDVMAMVDKYRKALDKIAVRGDQINQATESMGVTSSLEGVKDIYMDAEMKEMMGGEGKTVGERNRMLQQKFGDGIKGAPKIPGAAALPKNADTSLTMKP